MFLIIIYSLILILYGTIVILIPGIGFAGIFQNKKIVQEPPLHISIVVPFRNEAQHLEELCRSINRLNHPRDHFQVLFVDDYSDDDCLSILSILDEDVNYNLIQNPSHLGKKRSLQIGLESALYNWIFTTDADCIIPRNIFDGVSSNVDLSLGVALKTTETWRGIENIQEAESLLLAGITIGSAKMEIPMLASGANLLYRKEIMEELNPYEDNLDLNSGDDMFLLRSALKQNYRIDVRTQQPTHTVCEKSWDDYISQSARWAGKNDRVGLIQTNIAAWLVLLANLILPLSLITHFSFGWIMLMIKFVLDFLFLFLTALHFERFKVIIYAPVIFCFYPIHLLRVVIKIVNNKKKA
ncbi:MAG: glycosyltransferase [Flavobacteriales bacterium]|nr:glycosyltransferase [Flavobacteriales bacterium]MCB9195453.1 glycosyltransferase [Flavobacteriales bacterium]MCB9198357.1 glycosyltransferase [Flavobacteriales bacterium]